MNLYQGCKGMINGMRAMKEGGQMLWIAKCPEGCGTPDYTAWLQPLKEGRLDPALRADFYNWRIYLLPDCRESKKGRMQDSYNHRKQHRRANGNEGVYGWSEAWIHAPLRGCAISLKCD